MRRSLAKAAFLAGLVALFCLNAQPRGASRSFAGFRGSHRSFHSAPLTRPKPAPATSSPSLANNFVFPPVTGSSLINPGEASCILNPSFSGSFYCGQYFPGRPSFGAEPVFPSWFPSTGYESEESAPPASEAQPDTLSTEIGNLAAEVASLREDEASRQLPAGPAPPPSVTSEEKPPMTIFVYKDGREMEVQDYAILGDTLWVFSDQTTHRVPLTDIDLPETQRANARPRRRFRPPTSP